MKFLKNNRKIVLLSIIALALATVSVLSCGLAKVFILVWSQPEVLHHYLLTAIEGAEEIPGLPKASQVAGEVDVAFVDTTTDMVSYDPLTKTITIPNLYETSDDALVLDSYAIQFEGQDKAILAPVNENGELVLKMDSTSAAIMDESNNGGQMVIDYVPLFVDSTRAGDTRGTISANTWDTAIKSKQEQKWIFNSFVINEFVPGAWVHQGIHLSIQPGNVKTNDVQKIDVAYMSFSRTASKDSAGCSTWDLDNYIVPDNHDHDYIHYNTDSTNSYLTALTTDSTDDDLGVSIYKFTVNTGWTAGNRELKIYADFHHSQAYIHSIIYNNNYWIKCDFDSSAKRINPSLINPYVAKFTVTD